MEGLIDSHTVIPAIAGIQNHVDDIALVYGSAQRDAPAGMTD